MPSIGNSRLRACVQLHVARSNPAFSAGRGGLSQIINLFACRGYGSTGREGGVLTILDLDIRGLPVTYYIVVFGCRCCMNGGVLYGPGGGGFLARRCSRGRGGPDLHLLSSTVFADG